LTIPAIAPQAPADETLNASSEAHERIRSMTCEAPEQTIDEGVIRRGIGNLRWTRGKTGLPGVDGRLQAAALSGYTLKPPALPGDDYWSSRTECDPILNTLLLFDDVSTTISVGGNVRTRRALRPVEPARGYRGYFLCPQTKLISGEMSCRSTFRVVVSLRTP
jgi:hypothetical protein